MLKDLAQKSSFDRSLSIYDFSVVVDFVISKMNYSRTQLVQFIAMSATHGRMPAVRTRSTTPLCQETSHH
jgi:hypothetical protein